MDDLNDAFLYDDEGHNHPFYTAKRFKLTYKATIQDDTTKIEWSLDDGGCKHLTARHKDTWYDMGNGQHVSEYALDRLTKPYGG
jgi:hypothetical protein